MIDYSTLNVAELLKLPVAVIAPGCHVSDSRGQGCFMNPPGYPTHFLQSVYTARGNNPSRGSDQVIFHPETGYREVQGASGPWLGADAHKALMRSLWVPLPCDSERVQGWLAHAAGYFRNTEQDGPFQRGFYPDAVGALPPAYGVGGVGDWVNLFSARPVNGRECVAQQRFKYDSASPYWNRHPLNNSWCQHCGWVFVDGGVTVEVHS